MAKGILRNDTGKGRRSGKAEEHPSAWRGNVRLVGSSETSSAWPPNSSWGFLPQPGMPPNTSDDLFTQQVIEHQLVEILVVEIGNEGLGFFFGEGPGLFHQTEEGVARIT